MDNSLLIHLALSSMTADGSIRWEQFIHFSFPGRSVAELGARWKELLCHRLCAQHPSAAVAVALYRSPQAALPDVSSSLHAYADHVDLDTDTSDWEDAPRSTETPKKRAKTYSPWSEKEVQRLLDEAARLKALNLDNNIFWDELSALFPTRTMQALRARLERVRSKKEKVNV